MPNIKLHDYASNAIVELNTDAIVYRTEHSTADIPHTHLALAYNYTLDVKETPEQIDILAKGGSLDDWVEYNGHGVCPVPESRKVIVRIAYVERVYLVNSNGTKEAGKYLSNISPEPILAGSANWDSKNIYYFDEDWNEEQYRRIGLTEYKIIGY